MSDPVFVQYSRMGRAIFAIEGVCLEITQRIRGKKQVQLIPLHSLAPDHTRARVRDWSIILRPLFVAVLLGSLAFVAWRSKEQAFQAWAIDLAIFGALFFCLALRGVPKAEVELFFERNGRPAFCIVRSRKQLREVDGFVAELVSRIEAHSGADSSKKGSPNNSPLPMPGTRPISNLRQPPGLAGL